MVLHDLGAALGELERYDEAVSPMRQALTNADISGVDMLRALCLLTLGRLLERLGRYEEAIPYAVKAREMGIQLQLLRRAAFACTALGVLHLKTGRKDLGSAAFEEALALLADPEDGPFHYMVYLNLGTTSREIGDYEAAESALTSCADLSRTNERVLLESEAWHELGRVAIERGQLEKAGECLRHALELAEREDDWLRQAAVEVDIGHALHAAGKATEARRHWRTALAIHQEHGTETSNIEGLLGMAET